MSWQLALGSALISAYTAVEKRKLAIAGAEEMKRQTSENEIAFAMQNLYKYKDFRRSVRASTKKGAYTGASILLSGRQKEATLKTKLAKSGARLGVGTPLNLRVQEAMFTEYAVAMNKNDTYMNIDNATNSYHDWKTVSTWQHNIQKRRDRKKTELMYRQADVGFAGDVVGGVGQFASIYNMS